MSGGNTLFINLHYTDKVVYTCQEVMLYLSPHTGLTSLPYQNQSLVSTIHQVLPDSSKYNVYFALMCLFVLGLFTDKVVYTCQEVMLYLSPHTGLTSLHNT
jgi:hypothetical protein